MTFSLFIHQWAFRLFTCFAEPVQYLKHVNVWKILKTIDRGRDNVRTLSYYANFKWRNEVWGGCRVGDMPLSFSHRCLHFHCREMKLKY